MRNDLRFGLRTLWRSPGFTLLAVLSLALGIGANTAIFSLLYQVVLRSLPVKDPGSLAVLESTGDNYGYTRRDNNQTVFSYPLYQALRDRNEVFTGLVARVSFQADLAYRGEPRVTTAEVVTGNFFEVLGVRPALGRLLLPSDDGAPGQNPVLVLSYAYWTAHLGGDPAVLNTRILMNRQPVVIVGVAPRGFRGLLTGRDPDFFASMSMIHMVAPGLDRVQQPDFHWLNLVGRLKSGISPARGGAMLQPLFGAVIRDELPQMHDIDAGSRQKLLAKRIRLDSAAQGLNVLRAQWQKPLLVLAVMAGLALLIACANVANLLLARATSRQREIAIRLAMGATRTRLARQLLVESAILALAGGFAGLLLSANLAEGLLRLLPVDATGGWLTASLDVRLLACSLALALLTGCLFGLAPASYSLRASVAPALKNQTAGLSASGSQSRTRQALMVAQICLSLLLLMGAALFTRSLINLVHSDPGFQTDRLLTFMLDPSLSGYSLERRLTLFRDLRDRLSATPGVSSVASAYLIPLGGWGFGSGVKVPGSRNADHFVGVNANAVSPGYFHTLGVPLPAGRAFLASDGPRSPKVAILSQALAHLLFENANPIGRRVEIGSINGTAEVVGVARDSRINDVREQPPRILYVPFEQGGDELTQQSAFFIRTTGDERTIMTSIRGVVRSLDANLPIDRLTGMRAIIDDTIYTDRLLATLAIAFAILAATLAAVGLYGALSYSVARRSREFGIRLALGEAPGGLLLCVMREVGWLLAIGMVIGLPASYALGRLAESQLYGIHAHDPAALAAATILIILVGLAAGLAPALRAMRIDPLTALRYE